MHKNKFMNQIVDNIRLERNLTCMLRTLIICNLTIKFSKYVAIKTLPQLCKYCLLRGSYPSWFCSSPKAHNSKGKGLYTLKEDHFL